MKQHLIETLNRALENGYDIRQWPAEQIAEDVGEYDAEFQNINADEMIPIIREWKIQNPEVIYDSMRHLIVRPYNIDRLHEAAKRLNIKRCWFHKTHYDIPLRRMASIGEDATLVSAKTIAALIHRHER